MAIANFLKHFGNAKLEQAGEGIVNLAAAIDADGVSEAAIKQKQEEHAVLVKQLVDAKDELKREKQEFLDIEAVYNKKLAAAERAQEAGDDAAAAELLDAVEKIVPKLEKERKEFEDAERWLTEVQQAADEVAKELLGLREQIDAVKSATAEAKLATQKAQKEQARAEQLAGLRKSSNKFDVAMAALQKQADNQRKEAETAKTIADQLRKPTETVSSAAAKYLEDAPATSNESVADRLARLKAGK